MKRLEELLYKCHLAKVSPLLNGVHGIGKSERVIKYSKNKKFYCEPLFLSNQETGDLIGTMERSLDNPDVFYWTKPNWLHRMEQAYAKGIICVLFLDELNRARLDVRQAILQLVLTGRIHQHELPEGTMVVAAINPSSDDYQVQELDEALLDRFVVFDLFPDANEWLEWAKENEVHNSVVDFISNHHKYIWCKKNDGEANGPSPRGWVMTSDFIKTLNENETELLLPFLIGKVGASVGMLFYNFFKNNSQLKIDQIEAICKNKTKDNLPELVNEIKKLIEKEEIQRIHYIGETLVEKYFADNLNKKLTYEKTLPVFAFLEAISSEILHAILKTIKITNEKVYNKLCEIDISLVKKIVNLKIKFELEANQTRKK